MAASAKGSGDGTILEYIRDGLGDDVMEVTQ